MARLDEANRKWQENEDRNKHGQNNSQNSMGNKPSLTLNEKVRMI